MNQPNTFVRYLIGAVIFLLVLLAVVLNWMVFDTDRTLYTSSPKSLGSASLQSDDPKEFSVDGIVSPLQSQNYHYLKADFAFQMRTKSAKNHLEDQRLKVRTLLLKHLATMDGSFLSKPNGKALLEEQLITLVEEHFGEEVEAFYFKNFVLVP